MEVVFARMGYFHAAAETLQVIRFMKDPGTLPLNLRPYIFRIEPRATTPFNEFDAEFEQAIRNEEPYAPKVTLSDVQHVVVEVSSLSVNTHLPSGCILHTNPNFSRNVPYSELYPLGYYSKFEPDVSVEKSETGLEDLVTQLSEIRREVPHANVVVMGHLRSESNRNATRDKIHGYLQEASARSGCIYFDNALLLEQYGFDDVDGVCDIHHLTHEGEQQLGREIFSLARSLD